ncbi:hypothetical protein D9M69_612480 [compost metagenome]
MTAANSKGFPLRIVRHEMPSGDPIRYNALEWREYEHRGAGAFVTVTRNHAGDALSFAVECRSTGDAGAVNAWRCETPDEFAQAVLGVHAHIAASPVDRLRVVTDERLPLTLSARLALVLAGAMAARLT